MPRYEGIAEIRYKISITPRRHILTRSGARITRSIPVETVRVRVTASTPGAATKMMRKAASREVMTDEMLSIRIAGLPVVLPEWEIAVQAVRRWAIGRTTEEINKAALPDHDRERLAALSQSAIEEGALRLAKGTSLSAIWDGPACKTLLSERADVQRHDALAVLSGLAGWQIRDAPVEPEAVPNTVLCGFRDALLGAHSDAPAEETWPGPARGLRECVAGLIEIERALQVVREIVLASERAKARTALRLRRDARERAQAAYEATHELWMTLSRARPINAHQPHGHMQASAARELAPLRELMRLVATIAAPRFVKLKKMSASAVAAPALTGCIAAVLSTLHDTAQSADA